MFLSYGPSPEAAVQDEKENTKPVKVQNVKSIQDHTASRCSYTPGQSCLCSVKSCSSVVFLYTQLPDYLPEHDPHTAVDSDTVSELFKKVCIYTHSYSYTPSCIHCTYACMYTRGGTKSVIFHVTYVHTNAHHCGCVPHIVTMLQLKLKNYRNRCRRFIIIMGIKVITQHFWASM